MIKKSEYEAAKKLASDAETIDRANAIELGFAKAAHDEGLSEEQYQAIRQITIERLSVQK